MPHGPLLKHIGPPALAGGEQVFFLKEHLGGLPVGRAVDPLVGDIDDPVEEPGVEIIEARELLPPEEPLDVLDAGPDLAFGLGPVRPMGRGPEAAIAAEVPEGRVPLEP